MKLVTCNVIHETCHVLHVFKIRTSLCNHLTFQQLLQYFSDLHIFSFSNRDFIKYVSCSDKKGVTKIIYDVYNKCSGFDKYWLKNSVFFSKNYKLTILSLKSTNMKDAISKC